MLLESKSRLPSDDRVRFVFTPNSSRKRESERWTRSNFYGHPQSFQETRAHNR